MKHVVSTPTPPFLAMGGALEVHQIPAHEDNLIWVLVCTETREAAVVDGPYAGDVLAYCEKIGVRWTTILNTHTHADHVGINLDLRNKGVLGDYRVVGAASTASAVPGITEKVSEGDVVAVGKVEGCVWLTEGHIDGHISFLFGDALFCGDTMFAGGCGYLFDGPPAKMSQSLLRLAELPGDTRVCCAHEYTEDNLRFAWSVEPDNAALAERIRKVWAIRAEGGCTVPSTIEEERATNPFLRPGSVTLLAKVTAGMPDAPMGTPAEVFGATRALKDTRGYRAAGDDGLPLDG